MNKKHLIAVFALVIALVLPISLIAVTLASDTVAEIAENALSYEGVAAKAVKQPGVRSLWRVNNDNVKALEEKGYDVYYGSIMAAKKDAAPDCEALTVVYDAETNTVSADASLGNVGVVTVYDPFGNGSNKFVTETEESSVFAYTTLFDFDDNALFDTELVYAGWLVTVSDSGEVDYYYDYPVGTALASRLDTYEKGGQLHYTSFTLSAVCDYFVNEYRGEEGNADYVSNTIMNTVLDEERALTFDDLTLGFARGKSTHIGNEINLVSGIQNMYLLRINTVDEGYYSVRIRYALADAEKGMRFYLRSRFDTTSVSTFEAEDAVAAVSTDGGYTVPEGTDYAEQKLYIYLTAGEHIIDLWTESETVTAVSSIVFRCDRVKSDLSLALGITNYEVRTNGYEVVQQVAEDAKNPSKNYALRGYLAEGGGLTTVNPTRLGYALMKAGSYFDYTVSVGTPGYYDVIGDVGIGVGSSIRVYDITGMGLKTGEAWTPSNEISPIFVADKATAGGADSRVTDCLGEMKLKAGTRTLRVYVTGDVAYRQLFVEKNGVNFLTVNYVDENGVVLAPQAFLALDRYTTYSVPSPLIENYTADQKVVSGVLTDDRTVTVTYTATADTSDRTVTFVYGLAGDETETVTVANGETLTAPAASAIDGYYVLWLDAYDAPVYDINKVGDGAILYASYERTATVETFASVATASGVAHFVEGDATQIKLYDSASSTGYFSTGGFMRMIVNVPHSGVYALRIKAASTAQNFEVATRVNGVTSINTIDNTAFVKDGGIVDEAGKAAAYTSAAQTWVYLKEGSNTLDLCTRNTTLSVYSAELRLVTEMTDASDVAATLLTRAGQSGANSETGYGYGTYLDKKETYVEYAVKIPTDGVYSLYFLLGTIAANQNSDVTVTDVTTGRTLGTLVGLWSNHYRGMQPVKIEAALVAGTHTFRITANNSTRTNTVGVVAVRTGDIVRHNATFNYGENTVTNSVVTGYTTTPPAAEKNGYRLEWLDESGAVVSDFSTVTITSDRVFTARYIDIEADVTFVYGDKSTTVTVTIGDAVTPPTEDAEKDGFYLAWLDEEGNKVSDFSTLSITDDRTFTAEYLDYSRYEFFASDMELKGTAKISDSDSSIIVISNGAYTNHNTSYVEITFEVYKSGLYTIGIRGEADSYFDLMVYANGFYYGNRFDNTGSILYDASADYALTEAQKTGAYKTGISGSQNQMYLPAGTNTIRISIVNAGNDKQGSLALYSAELNLVREIEAAAKTPSAYKNMSDFASYSNYAICRFKVDAESYGDYTLTLEPGTYHILGLAGALGTATYYYVVMDASDNVIAELKSPTATYGDRKFGAKPAEATETLTVTESGTYTVRVTFNDNTNWENTFFGVYAEKIPEYDVTFVYGEESQTTTYLRGTVAVPPAEADRKDYGIKWVDKDGKTVTDFTVTGKATYTAVYVDMNNLEVFANDFTAGGTNPGAVLASDGSIFLLPSAGTNAGTQNSYITFNVYVYKSGIYKVGIRGKADLFFNLMVQVNGYRHGTHFNNTGSSLYSATTDHTMTDAEKSGSYKYGAGTQYLSLYLPEGPNEIKVYIMHGTKVEDDNEGSLGLYSFCFALMYETAAGAKAPSANSGMASNNGHGNDGKVRFGSEDAYGDYKMTLTPGTYRFIGLAGTAGNATYHYVLLDKNGNEIGRTKSPTATYGNYKYGAMPAVANEWITVETEDEYTVRVYCKDSTRYDANNFFGVYAERHPEYNVTFVYGEETKTVSALAGGGVTPPADAAKEGFAIEWLDESGNLVTDFSTITSDRTFTAKYSSENEVKIIVRGVSPLRTVLIPEMARLVTTKNTPYAIALPAFDGYILSEELLSGTTGDENLLRIDVVVYREAIAVSPDEFVSEVEGNGVLLPGGEGTLDTYVLAKGAMTFWVEADIVGVYAVQIRFNKNSSPISDVIVKNLTVGDRSTRYRVGGSNKDTNVTPEDFIVAANTGYITVGYIRLAQGKNEIRIHHNADRGYLGFADVLLTPVAPEWDENSVALNYNSFALSGGAITGEEALRLTSTDHYGTARITIGKTGYYDIRSIMGTGNAATLFVDITNESGTTQTFSYATTGLYNITGTYWDACTTETVIAEKVYLEAGTYTVKLYSTNARPEARISISDLRLISLPTYDVTFTYGDQSVTSIYFANETATATPPSDAAKEGFAIEWLDESGAAVTDFAVKGDAIYTARYIAVAAQNYMMNTLFNEEKIKVNGRTGTDGDGIICDDALAGFEMNVGFVGDLTLTVTAKNPVNSTTADGPRDAYFTVYIDGVRSETRFCFPAGETTTLTIATSDGTKTHHIRVVKQNEAQFVLTTLESLSFTGYFGAKPEDKDLYIEFMGDSISTGWGNLGEYGMPSQHQPLYQDATQGYFNLVAEALDADASLSGCAGIGMIAGGYAVLPQFTEFYGAQSYFRDATVATKDGRTPDMIIMSLGTNDLRYGATEDDFKASMLAFIAALREDYGNIPVILVYGQMTTRLATVMPAIEAAAENVYAYELRRNEAGGGGHPSIEGCISAKEELLALMRADGLI